MSFTNVQVALLAASIVRSGLGGTYPEPERVIDDATDYLAFLKENTNNDH